jgi:uncharacterized protein (DUF3820 family)
MYSDTSILTFGKYKFKKLRDIPASYLIKLYNDKGINKPELREYIERNIERLKSEAGYGIDVIKVIKKPEVKKPEIIKIPTFVCDKVTFATEKIAKSRLREINNARGNNKKPIRAYECEKCGGWHHTSIPLDVFKKNNLK